MSRVRTYTLELDLSIDDDTPDALVEAMLPNVVRYSTAGEAIDTGLFGSDDHLVADVLALRYVAPRETIEDGPVAGDVLYFQDGESFEYVFDGGLHYGDGNYEVITDSGAAYLAHRAWGKDDILRQAVHDDGTRRAWKVV